MTHFKAQKLLRKLFAAFFIVYFINNTADKLIDKHPKRDFVEFDLCIHVNPASEELFCPIILPKIRSAR
jgi:hypothetical protein